MIIVAKDGSGHFNNIQDAIDSISINNNEETEIYIKKS